MSDIRYKWHDGLNSVQVLAGKAYLQNKDVGAYVDS
jgi:hypothetical protein